MTKVLVIVILLLTFESTCTQRRAAETPTASVTTHEAVELEILRAVFQYQIQHCYRDRNLGLYFLSYKERDPAEHILKSFSAHQSVVQPQSQMVVS